MNGKRLIHAHRLVQTYCQLPVPSRMYTAKSDGEGREYTRTADAANPLIMKCVADYPVYYWDRNALAIASTWMVGKEESAATEAVNKLFSKPPYGAIHFFDVPQIVNHPEHDGILCVGIIRYGTAMVSLLYVDDVWDWDDIKQPFSTYNIYFANGSAFAEFYMSLTLAWESWAMMPEESEIKPPVRKFKGIDQRTVKSYNDAPIKVVVLRKYSPNVVITGARVTAIGAMLRDDRRVIGVQFDVKGHNRNQWYPSEGKHRVVWIEGYRKGKDKPMASKPTVHKVVDRSGS